MGLIMLRMRYFIKFVMKFEVPFVNKIRNDKNGMSQLVIVQNFEGFSLKS